MIRIAVIVGAALVGCVAGPSAHASTIVWGQGSGGNGHAYEFVQGSLIGWDEASAAAQAMTFGGVSGHLATITDGAEQYFINSIPSLDPSFFPGGIGMWLGGFQANPDDPPNEGWSWVTGETWSFTNWIQGEPDDAFKPESHLAMIVPTELNPEGTSGEWGDFPGAAFMWFGISGFLVEYDLPACASDINGDGSVDGIDLGMLLANWSVPPGSSGCGGTVPCTSDLNGDGSVDGLDIGILLAHWSIPPGAPGCA